MWFRLRICCGPYPYKERAARSVPWEEQAGSNQARKGTSSSAHKIASRRAGRSGTKPVAKAEEEPLCTSDVCVGPGTGRCRASLDPTHGIVYRSVEGYLLEPVTHSRRDPKGLDLRHRWRKQRKRGAMR